ncbi:MAG: iron-containing alcohol dehydrogenase [Proteobacteria bacterium]|nr:iron-containing alcohol dehydrogenase [Pseudomonadota bacterium]
MIHMLESGSIEFNYTALETVVSGEAVASALYTQIERLDAKRVFLVASASLSERTDQFDSIKQALGGHFAGLFNQIGAHTPRKDVLQGLRAAREADADLLVSLGGGSIIDACKVIQLAIDQDIQSEQQLLEYAQLSDGTRGPKAGDYSLFSDHSKIRQIAVPTTLSGAEFSNNAGVLDTEKSAKEGYRGVDLCPQCIIYDPALSVHTPEWLWLSTAIRSLDHAVEGYCSADSHAYLDGHFLHAMRLFAESLPLTKHDPCDLASRHANQQAVWLACCGLGTVAHGASHGIGYILGSLCSVPHGYTSCVMLPAVLEWNAKDQVQRQQAIAAALGKPDESASAAVKSLVRSLDLPTTLQQVGVQAEQLATIAERAIQHPVVRRNPRTLEQAEQIMEILQLAWD